MRRIGQEFGTFVDKMEPGFLAYRSEVDKFMAVTDAGLPPLPGPYIPIRAVARIINRVCSEAVGMISYRLKLRKKDNTPEKILRHNRREIACWQETGYLP